MVARPDGEVVGASLSGRDFLQELRLGRRHFFHTDEPELPSSLARAIAHSVAGQTVVSETCTARFEHLAPTGGAWMPVLGIEFFLESSAQRGLALSKLTPVERDIYVQIVAGATNAEIARRRGTAFTTVKNQVSHLLDKLGVSRRINLLSPPDVSQFLQANSAAEGGLVAVTR
jgi:DNA-binding NarL/FixJ family response regulator